MSASILPFLQGQAFEPEQVKAMGLAFDKCAKSLHDRGQPPVVREVIAKKIIEIAKTGELDTAKICARALQELGFEVR